MVELMCGDVVRPRLPRQAQCICVLLGQSAAFRDPVQYIFCLGSPQGPAKISGHGIGIEQRVRRDVVHGQRLIGRSLKRGLLQPGPCSVRCDDFDIVPIAPCIDLIQNACHLC